MKKKMFWLFILITVVCFVPNVYAANISSCDAALGNEVLIDQRIPSVISTLVTIIKIAVPILLVIFGSLDLIKGITAQKEDEIKKGQQLLIKRLIAGALVFFVFTVVQLVVSFAAGNGGDNKKASSQNIMTCVNCFINNKCTTK